MGQIHMVDVLLGCERCDRTTSIRMSLMGNFGAGMGFGINCECGGRMMSLGRYGSLAVGDSHFTVMTSATDAELKRMAEHLARLAEQADNMTPEAVADLVEQDGTELAKRLGQWIRANGGSIGFAALLVALIELLVTVQATQPEPPQRPDRFIINIDLDRPGELPRGAERPQK